MIKGVTETVEREVKEKRGLLGTLAATLGFSLLGNIWAGSGIIRAAEGTIRAGKGTLWAFGIQKCYENKAEFKCIYSRNNLPKTREGKYVINLDE